MIESLQAALDANEAVADAASPRSGGPRNDLDLLDGGALAVAADLGIDEVEAQVIAKTLMLHVGSKGDLSIGAIRRHPRLSVLAVGMIWGYLHRRREEMVTGPEPAIRNQIIGYLKGKASAARDEEANAPTSDARSELNKRATTYELAAEALESED